MRSTFGRPTLAAVAAAFLLSGCELLYPGLSADEDGWLESATYTSGSATLTLGGEPDGVRELSLRAGSFDDYLGSSGVFGDDEGWAVSITGTEGSGDALTGLTELDVHRAVLGHWVARSWPANCDIDIEQADTSGFRGTATCRDLRWTDAITELVPTGPALPYVEGEAPFEATITFSAESVPSTVRRTASPTDPPPVDLDGAADAARALPTVEEVIVDHDWLDGDSLEVVLAAPATDTAAREVWCSILLPAGIGAGHAYVGDATVYWEPPSDCADLADVPSSHELALTNGFEIIDDDDGVEADE